MNCNILFLAFHIEGVHNEKLQLFTVGLKA
jgi:hypothetical protein